MIETRHRCVEWFRGFDGAFRCVECGKSRGMEDVMDEVQELSPAELETVRRFGLDVPEVTS